MKPSDSELRHLLSLDLEDPGPHYKDVIKELLELREQAETLMRRLEARNHIRQIIEELLELREQVRWRPISEAPKDGTRVMLYRPTSHYQWTRVVAGEFKTDQYAKKPRPFWTHDREMLSGMAEVRAHQPTHWMPLPEPPKEE